VDEKTAENLVLGQQHAEPSGEGEHQTARALGRQQSEGQSD